MASRPPNVGILALEVYFPPSRVLQAELEKHDGVSTGKYTIGLGQESLGFCQDQEDVISMSLTVVQALFENYNISPSQIGRLDVGSETVLDKSKSIKTSIMTLFEASGNSDVEGVDSSNACYGGTAALLNALDWVESSAWDGRYALVVASDSAVYAEGPARPTGGAGAVAMLIGPDAPLTVERALTASHMAHAYDFYKPKLASEYPVRPPLLSHMLNSGTLGPYYCSLVGLSGPCGGASALLFDRGVACQVVDGKLSQMCYLAALDKCYARFCKKFEKREGKRFSLEDAAYCVFHSPYNKLVQKSYARLVYNEFLRSDKRGAQYAPLEPFVGISQAESYTNRDLEKACSVVAKEGYTRRVVPTANVPRQVGNMYCGSLYASLASLIDHTGGEIEEGTRLLVFSYGSGLASTIFSLRVRAIEGPFSLDNVAKTMGIQSRLKARTTVAPAEFVETMELMEKRYGACGYEPVSPVVRLYPGTFYLTKVDDMYRRTYARKPRSLEDGVGKEEREVPACAENGAL